MKTNLLKYENSKLKQQFIFNLPVSMEVCGRECPGCYALKAQKRFPKTVLPYREARLEASKQEDFVPNIIAELTTSRRSAKSIRIHESGEFYSQEYIDKWATIAKAVPTFTFYAFTKRMKDFDFTAIKALPNVIIIDSLMSGTLNYAPLNKLDPSRPICPATMDDTTVCGVTCLYCQTKQAQTDGIQFVKH